MTEKDRELIDQTPRLYFDTRVGIEMTLEKEKYPLQRITKLRKLYKELHPEEKLAEFVVYGQFLLTKNCEVYRILGVIPNLGDIPEVVIEEEFVRITGLDTYRCHIEDTI